jgi:hypothetical protein
MVCAKVLHCKCNSHIITYNFYIKGSIHYTGAANVTDAVLGGFGKLEEGKNVWKYGRTTGCTTGKVQGLCADIKFDNKEPATMDWVIPARNSKPFSLGGDSGSWVTNHDGEVVAHIFGGCLDLNLSYISPIDFVLDRIKFRIGLELIPVPYEL